MSPQSDNRRPSFGTAFSNPGNTSYPGGRPRVNNTQIPKARSSYPGLGVTTAADLIRSAGVVATLALSACSHHGSSSLSDEDRRAIAREISERVVAAYDLNRPGAVERLMSLYPSRGPVFSAGAGQFTTSRDSLASGIRSFWENVGRNMRDPQWQWTAMRIDVLSPAAAAMTATYRVPHRTPRGDPHVIAGAWTAVFEKRDGQWVIVHEHLSDRPEPSDTTVRAAPDTGADAHIH
jgi:ketosteroid isomerase-like protein